jgi:hypothetical protein
MFDAIEGRVEIFDCMNLLERKFGRGAENINGLKHGALWLPQLGMCGHFSASGRRSPPVNYWNVFGQQPSRLRQNMIVEINPPAVGRNLNRQGMLAKDKKGHRWLLHRGRLHPRDIRITEDMFDTVAGANRVQVRYSDGTFASCHRVTDIDRPSSEVQHDVAAFVELCAKIRVHYLMGDAARIMFDRVNVAEGSSSPELQGRYDLPAMPPRVVKRRHADVWHALVKTLDRLSIVHSNSRFGRFGPDLLAHGTSENFLFEIKPDVTASDIQCAIGQLHLYEQLGGFPCRKVMVLPLPPAQEILGALRALNIDLVCFEKKGASIQFDYSNLRKLILGPSE